MEQDGEEKAQEIDGAEGFKGEHRVQGVIVLDKVDHVIGQGIIRKLGWLEGFRSIDQVTKDKRGALVGEREEGFDLPQIRNYSMIQ